MSTEVSRLFDFPYYQQENCPQKVALATKHNGKWEKTSIEEYIEKGNLISRGLLKLGIKPGDKVAIISSNNRTEWNIIDLGSLQIGAIDVPIYPTISAKEFEYIFSHSEAKICFVSDKELYEKASSVIDRVTSLKHIFTFDEVVGAKNWKEVLKLGEEIEIQEVEKIKSTIKQEDLATLIYTSGTTGTPKGVMLSHQNIVSNVLASIDTIEMSVNFDALSFLPVCHIYERMIHYAYVHQGVSIYFAENLDKVADNLQEVKPHAFTTVPRLLEKVYDKIVAKGEALSGIKKMLFNWSLNLALSYEVNGKNGAWYELQLKLARKLVFTKWQDALGGNIQFIACGSAALQERLSRVFNGAGIAVLEGYGLTETSPVCAVNSKLGDGMRFGTVGKKLSGVTIKIASDGEILIKGPNVMLGYFKDESLTEGVIDPEGWFHTGDIGTFVEGEFLKITDRKKEIFKTSGGKYIAPQQMENKFKESPFIEQIIVIGENKKHSAAIIVPSFEYIKEWRRSQGFSFTNNKELVENETVVQKIEQEIERLNKNFGKWEQVKKIELVASEWSVDSGELTPTLKLKRKIIMAKYNYLVEKIYN